MVSKKLEEVMLSVQKEFSGLSDHQLNLKPAEDKWSIAQCLDHLIVSNETYIPAFEALLKGGYKQTFWQSINPLTSFAGKKGVELLKSGKIKLKAPAIFAPSKDDEIKDIVSRFVTHQQKMKVFFDKLEKAGLQDKVISSPVTSVLTVKTGDALNIIAEHEARHLGQAINVKHACIGS